MKPETRNGAAHIDTDIPQPTDFDESIDPGLFYLELGVFIIAALMLVMAGLSGLIYVGVI